MSHQELERDLDAAQKQIEHLRDQLTSCHMARKDARDARRAAMELLQRASLYAHGQRWPQDMFAELARVLGRYESGLPLAPDVRAEHDKQPHRPGCPLCEERLAAKQGPSEVNGK